MVGRNCRFLQGPETDPSTVQQVISCLIDLIPFSEGSYFGLLGKMRRTQCWLQIECSCRRFHGMNDFTFADTRMHQGRKILHSPHPQLQVCHLNSTSSNTFCMPWGLIQPQLFRKNGSRFWNSLHIAPVRNCQGKVGAFLQITHLPISQGCQEAMP